MAIKDSRYPERGDDPHKGYLFSYKYTIFPEKPSPRGKKPIEQDPTPPYGTERPKL